MVIYKSDDPNDVIRNWMRGRDTLEFLGLWESLHNPNFKPVEFDAFRSQAGTHAFTMSPSKWIAGVDAISIVVKVGRYGWDLCPHGHCHVLCHLDFSRISALYHERLPAS